METHRLQSYSSSALTPGAPGAKLELPVSPLTCNSSSYLKGMYSLNEPVLAKRSEQALALSGLCRLKDIWLRSVLVEIGVQVHRVHCSSYDPQVWRYVRSLHCFLPAPLSSHCFSRRHFHILETFSTSVETRVFSTQGESGASRK